MISTTSAAHYSILHSPLQLNSKPDPNTYPGRNVPNFRSCFCGARSSDSANVADHDPVLLVSRIAGSNLNSKSKKTGSETRVWVRILLADLEFRRKLWSIYNPETGYTESLDDDSEIVVPQDDYGLYAIDILDPSTFVRCLHVSDLYHFHDMIEMLVGCGYEKGTHCSDMDTIFDKAIELVR